MSSEMTRREMLGLSAGVLGGLGLLQGCAHLAPSSKRKGSGFMIGACDWTLGKRASVDSISLAAKIGLDGVLVDFGDPVEDELPLNEPDLSDAIIQASEREGVAVPTLALGTLNKFPLKSDPRSEGWLCDAIDTGARMKAGTILVACFGAGDIRGDSEGVDVVAGKLGNLASKAEKAGVVLGLESWLSAEEHMEILNRVNSPSVKVYYDVANSHKRGYNIFEEIRFLGEHICEFHAKDYDGLYGKGSIDFPKVREAMDDVGYRGWIIMEGTQMPLGIEESCRYDLAYLRSIFIEQKRIS